MQNIQVQCTYSPGMKPEYATIEAAGADLKADIAHHVILPAGESIIVPTGVYLSIPEGYEGQVRPRSGLSAKYGVTVLNAPGTIDSDYRGEIKVILLNTSKKDFTITRGDRIAQLVISPVVQATFIITDVLDQSERGNGGFGSTGR